MIFHAVTTKECTSHPRPKSPSANEPFPSESESTHCSPPYAQPCYAVFAHLAVGYLTTTALPYAHFGKHIPTLRQHSFLLLQQYFLIYFPWHAELVCPTFCHSSHSFQLFSVAALANSSQDVLLSASLQGCWNQVGDLACINRASSTEISNILLSCVHSACLVYTIKFSFSIWFNPL